MNRLPKRHLLLLAGALALLTLPALAAVIQQEDFTSAQVGTLPATLGAEFDPGVDVKVVTLATLAPVDHTGGDGYVLQNGDTDAGTSSPGGGYDFCFPASPVDQTANATEAWAYFNFTGKTLERDYGIAINGAWDGGLPANGVYPLRAGYWLLVTVNSSWGTYIPPNNQAFLLKRVGGAWIQIGNVGTGTYDTGWHKLRIEFDGVDTVKGYVDGNLECTATDSPASFPSGFPYLVYFDDNSTNEPGAFDNFLWETISAAPSPTPTPSPTPPPSGVADNITDWTVVPSVNPIVPPSTTPEDIQMAGSAIIGNYLYLLGGNRTTDGDSGKVSRFFIDPISGLVSAGVDITPSLLDPTTEYAYINDQVVATEDHIYIIGGGFNTPGPANRNDVTYNQVDSGGNLVGATWSSYPLPTTPDYSPELGSALLCQNGYLYAFGGDTNSLRITDACFYTKLNVDGTLGTFTQAANLPDPDLALPGIGWWFSFACTIGDYIIASPGITDDNTVSTGLQGTNAQDDVYICKVNPDGTMGTWTPGPALPATRYGAKFVAVGNTIFCIGGRDNNATSALRPQKTVWRAEFDPATGTLGAWSSQLDLPKTCYYHDANYSPITRRIYVSGMRVSTAAGDIDPDVWVSNELFPAPPPPTNAQSWNLYE